MTCSRRVCFADAVSFMRLKLLNVCSDYTAFVLNEKYVWK